ncbi:MAG: RHS repeat-associated core domain-containing protein, partial [Candidatus Ancaeobacter aquaticus]|nr:RHS repeat-associated core domain-containing protein [Candidatus Ancaeobacter aquaticus]
NKYYAKYLVKVTDVMGRQIKYKYDRKHNLIEKTYSDGVEVITKYDKKHRVIEQGSKNGQKLFSFKYDDGAMKVEFYQGDKKKKEYYYNEDNKITKEIDVLGNYTESEYDGDNNLIKFRDKNGNVYKYSYDNRGNITEMINPLGGKVRFKYKREINKLTEIINEKGAKTIFNYDTRGNLEEAINAEGGKTKFLNDKNGQPTAIIDPLDNMTSIMYDKKGNIIKITRHLGDGPEDTIVEKYRTDGIGRVTVYVDPNGNTTRYAYNPKGRLIRMFRKAGGGKRVVIRMAYDPFDNVTSIKDALGNVTRFEYTKDWWNNLEDVTDALGAKTKNVYDDYGKLIKSINAQGATVSYEYNELDRIIKVIQPNGILLKYKYDAAGNLIELIDGNENKICYVYDSLNRVIQITDGEGNKIRKEYDPVGNLTRLIDPKGGETSYKYNKANKLVSRKDQMGYEVLYAYNHADKLISAGVAEDAKVIFEYDTVGRMTKKLLSNGLAVLYKYDNKGNLTSIASEDKDEIELGYDNFNRVINVKTGGSEIEYVYDLNGNKTRMTVGNDIRVNYSYNKINRVKEIESKGKNVKYTYNKLGRKLKKIFSNGITSNYTYDMGGNLTLIESRNNSGDIIDSYEYSYDKADNRKTVKVLFETIAYTYDKNNQLIQAEYPDGSSENYFYDENGNRIKLVKNTKTETGIVSSEINCTYNPANRLIELLKKIPGFVKGNNGDSEKILYKYDTNGNLIEETRGDRRIIYVYNYENKLVNVVKNGRSIAEFSYDLFGRRIKKVEEGKSTRYFYDGSNILLMLDEKSKITSEILNGTGIDELLSVRSGKDREDLYYLQDGQNSVSAILSNDGDIKQRYGYAPFGLLAGPTSNEGLSAEGGAGGELTFIGTKTATDFRYTSRELDSSTGLYYYRARYYNPALGRFTQPDPLGMTDGINLYIYTRNNPIRWIDPLGLCVDDGRSWSDEIFDWLFPETEASTLPLGFTPPVISPATPPTPPDVPPGVSPPPSIVGWIIDLISSLFPGSSKDGGSMDGGTGGDRLGSGTIPPQGPSIPNNPVPPPSGTPTSPATITEPPDTGEGIPTDEPSPPRIVEPIYEPPPQDEGIPIEEPAPLMIVEPVPDIPDEQEGVPIDRPSTDDFINKSEKGKGGKEDWNKSDEREKEKNDRKVQKSKDRDEPKLVSPEKNRDYINEKVNEINPQQDKYKTKTGRAINNAVKAIGQTMDFADQLRTDK